MNERIKDLLPNPFAVDYQAENAPLDLYTEKEMLKFAKLIAQDCISQIALIGVSNFENDDVMWAVGLAIENTEERYGIKK